MKTDKYRRLLSCCPSLLDAADKTANDTNEDLQNNIPAQVTAYVTAPVLFCYVCYILDSVKKNNINRTPRRAFGERKTCLQVAFLMGVPVKSAFALLLTKVTKPENVEIYRWEMKKCRER